MAPRLGTFLFAILVLALSTGYGVAGCSLSSVQPRFVQLKMSLPIQPATPGGRNPVLNAMQYFALVVSGESTVGAAALGGRQPSCLNVDGQITFPLTYEQLTVQGVQVSVNSGLNRFRVVGFHGSEVTAATAIAQIFSQPLAPAETYLVGDSGMVDLGTTTEVTVNSTYSTRATKNRAVFCPSDTIVKTPSASYRGVSGASTDAVTTSFLEAGIPPLNFNGDPMTGLASFVGSFTANSQIAEETALHPRVDITVPSGEYVGSGAWELIVYAKLKAGPAKKAGALCGDFISSTAGDAQIFLYHNLTTTWMSPTFSEFDDGVLIAEWDQNGTFGDLPINSELLFSIRANPYATPNCARMDIESVQITMRDPY